MVDVFHDFVGKHPCNSNILWSLYFWIILMPVTIDKILGKPLLHLHADKLSLSGGTITGDVTYPKTGMILTDANGLRWRLTVDTTGALTTTAIVEGTIGSPWLFLFGNI